MRWRDWSGRCILADGQQRHVGTHSSDSREVTEASALRLAVLLAIRPAVVLEPFASSASAGLTILDTVKVKLTTT